MTLDPEKPDKNEEEQRWIQQVGVYSLIPLIIAVSPILGWFIGNWLDSYFATAPYLMFLGILLGCAAAFREVYRIIRRFGDGS